ncbi:MAG: hypothetical protein VX252_08380 [Myxococcota bacterium]|nr:hypothetical protein [Myxococcota bacterium]
MDWILTIGGVVATVMSVVTPYAIYILQRRRDETQQARPQPGRQAERTDACLEHQRRKVLELLNHKTRTQPRIETLAKAFPELTLEGMRELLRSVDAEVLMRKDGSERWLLRQNYIDFINQHREAEGRKQWHPEPS